MLGLKTVETSLLVVELGSIYTLIPVVDISKLKSEMKTILFSHSLAVSIIDGLDCEFSELVQNYCFSFASVDEDELRTYHLV